MLREFQVQANKPIDATYKAKIAMKTGMGVVKNYTGDDVGKVAFPDAGTADGIFFVDKERVAKGVNAAQNDHSDYFSDYVSVAAGEFVKLVAYNTPGERFGTDAFTAASAPTVGKVVMIDTAGKVVDATASTVSSRYLCVSNSYNDAGNTLVILEVLDKAKANS